MITEPHWQTYKTFPFDILRAELKDWLLDAHSLTQKLQQHCSLFRVELLEQTWRSAFHSENIRLSLRDRQLTNIREVKLYCDNAPWVFARTVIPRATLIGKAERLLTLGNRSLGQVLFDDPQVKRSDFEFAFIKSEHYYFEKAITSLHANRHILVGRRSLFYLPNNKPLLVNEIFTNSFLEAMNFPLPDGHGSDNGRCPDKDFM